jgi:hypothetical protein
MSEEVTGPIDGQPVVPKTNWIDGLPEDVRSEKTLEKFKGDDGLTKIVQSYVGLEKKMGNAVWIPDPEKATPEDVLSFRAKLGVPESPDKYEIKYKEHEALKIDENMDKAYKELAHKVGLTPKQAQDLADFDADRFIDAHTSSAKAYEEAVNAVKEEWGNDYQVNIDRANNLIRTFADDKDKEAIARYGNDPALARIFNKIGLAMSEHSFVNSDKGADTAGNRQSLQDEAESLIQKMQDRKTTDVEKEMYNRKVREIYIKLYGTREVSGSGEMRREQ